jgi:hypothetical protein
VNVLRKDPVCPVYSLSTPYAYTKEKCRCSVCVNAHKERAKIYYQNYKLKIRQKRNEYRKKNRETENRKRREYSKRFPDKIKNQHLKADFGISLDAYNKLCLSQDNCCGICGCHQNMLVKKLAVDHDHNTGRVRGVLCSTCNLALGLLGDSKDAVEKFLRQTAGYLNKGEAPK